MPIRQHTEADAVDFAQRYGVRLATARTALGLQPQSAAADPKGDAARVYAAEHGLTVWQATKALHVAANSAQARASEAAAFAQLHGVSVVAAHKALGFDPGTSPFSAQVQRHAIENGVSLVDAAKALAPKR